MVNTSDNNIIGWAASGDSFVIRDVKAFSEKILPLYFKHSKFSSFVRQLNFYGFRKIRPDASVLTRDEAVSANAVRFFHECFRAGKPELLHKIQRTTRGTPLPSADPSPPEDSAAMRAEIVRLREELRGVKEGMEQRLEALQQSMEQGFRQRLARLEASCQEILSSGLFATRNHLLAPAPAMASRTASPTPPVVSPVVGSPARASPPPPAVGGEALAPHNPPTIDPTLQSALALAVATGQINPGAAMALYPSLSR